MNINASGYNKTVLVLTLLLVIVSASGCDWSISGISLNGPPRPEVVANLSASKYEYCPGEVITVTWDGGTQFDNCDQPGADLAACKHALLQTGPRGIASVDGYAPSDLNGYTSFRPGPGIDWIVFRYSVQVAAPRDRTGAPLAYDSPRDYALASAELHRRTPTRLLQEFNLTCDPTSHTWQFANQPPQVQSGPVSDDACVAVSSVTAAYEEVEVTDGNGQTTPLTYYEQNDSAFVGASLSELTINVAGNIGAAPHIGEPWATVLGQPCSPGDPAPLRRLDSHGREVLPWAFYVYYVLDCVDPSTIHDPQNRAACERRYPPSVPMCIYDPTVQPATCNMLLSQSITQESQPSATEGQDAPIPLCNLQVTCGDHTCDSLCETANNCPRDCAVSQPPVSTQPATEVVTEAVTEPPKACEPGWVPVDACVCCGPNRVCPDHVEENHSDCTGGGSTTGGNGGKKPVCGDGVCDDSEKGCGVCSADCGPC